MDLFGAHPLIMPYLFFEWGRGEYRLIDIIRPSHKNNRKIKQSFYFAKEN